MLTRRSSTVLSGLLLTAAAAVVSTTTASAADAAPPAAAPAPATTQMFTTSESEFLPGSRNQGWWASAATASNYDSNDNYIVGRCCAGGRPSTYRDFFTFDLSRLRGVPIAARLEVTRFISESESPTETLGLFDVSTAAATLNRTGNVQSKAIFDDLGSGTSYGQFQMPTAGDPQQVLSFPLNGAAVSRIGAARGGFFSIGGSLLSLAPGDHADSYFASSSLDLDPTSVQRLVVEVAATPRTAADCKDGGWRSLVDSAGKAFANKGRCVSFVQRH